MAKKRFGPEQVVAKLRQIEVLTAAGKALASKEAGITAVTYYRWRTEYGGSEGQPGEKDERGFAEFD
ncbi:MAG: hypothetical protein FJY51_09210 [Betaproteobacteria bacterium]|nr:hypothetical protein [Betaproteobacteria bacterium]MBM3384528.1 hypothetical protein [Betaproteobacteria bacterium]